MLNKSKETPQCLKALEADLPIIKWLHTLMQEIGFVWNRRKETLDNCFLSRKLGKHNCINKGFCDGDLVETWHGPNHDNANVPFGRDWRKPH